MQITLSWRRIPHQSFQVRAAPVASKRKPLSKCDVICNSTTTRNSVRDCGVRPVGGAGATSFNANFECAARPPAGCPDVTVVYSEIKTYLTDNARKPSLPCR